MIVAYIILAIVLLYIDFMLQRAGLSATIAIILLVVVLYKLTKLTLLIEEEIKERKKLRRQEAAQEEGKASKEDPEGTK
jgi:predicted membrane protein